MADKPILFSGPMVRALLDGRKTMTRRVLKPNKYLSLPRANGPVFSRWSMVRKGSGHQIFYMLDRLGREVWSTSHLPYAVGDRLWVRETHHIVRGDEFAVYREGYPDNVPDRYENLPAESAIKWRPSIFMPRWASRLTLIVTDVKVERVQDISEADAIAEGAPEYWRSLPDNDRPPTTTATGMFRHLWDSLNAKRGFGWDANPWVAAYTFTVHKTNIDLMEAA